MSMRMAPRSSARMPKRTVPATVKLENAIPPYMVEPKRVMGSPIFTLKRSAKSLLIRASPADGANPLAQWNRDVHPLGPGAGVKSRCPARQPCPGRGSPFRRACRAYRRSGCVPTHSCGEFRVQRIDEFAGFQRKARSLGICSALSA